MVKRTPLVARLVIAALIGSLLYFAQAAFIPVALSVLFALLLSSPVEALHKAGLPRSASAVLILVLFLGTMAGTLNLLWTPAQQWLAAAPQTVRTIERKIMPAARVLHRLNSYMDRAGHITDGSVASSSSSDASAVPVVASPNLLAETRAMIIAAVTIIILTLFLLTGGPPMLARMTSALASDNHASHVLKVTGAVRREVARYYGTVALINLGLGVATTALTWAFGISNPLLWGVMAAVLNFLPYVGSAITLIVLTIVAFLTFEGIGPVFAVAFSYLGIATVEGQVIQPLLVGQRLRLNPPIVFLALWFGGWFWGIAGIVVAIPALVALKVAAEHHSRGSALAEFLGSGRRKLKVTLKSVAVPATPVEPPVES